MSRPSLGTKRWVTVACFAALVFPVALASRLALNLDIVELNIHSLGLGLGDIIGKFQGLHHGLDGVLVLFDVVDAHVDAAAAASVKYSVVTPPECV